MIFLITGGTGFIGSLLSKHFTELQHNIVILTRQKLQSKNPQVTYINSLQQLRHKIDIVINLAGSPIATRWTKKNWQQIYDSRIETTKNIVDCILQEEIQPKLFISGSAIGYYGTSESTIFNENSQPSKQNLQSQQLCKQWEEEAKKASIATRLVLLRTGVVLAKNSGMISKILPSFLCGLGGNIGSGNQSISWIHYHDLVMAIDFIINNQYLQGPINAVCQHNTYRDFSKIIATQLHRPCLFNTPSALIKLLFGKMGEELLLSGQKVHSLKLQENNFNFNFNSLDAAISDIL
jgi:hypothetical protein